MRNNVKELNNSTDSEGDDTPYRHHSFEEQSESKNLLFTN